MVKPFVDAVNLAGDGVVQIEVFAGGVLGRDTAEQPQLVLDGIADIGVLVSGTWIVAKTTADHLLAQDATIAAHNWALYLVATVTDLEHIASGELPSAASMTFLDGARKAGQVFRYEVFNRAGFSQS